MVGSKFPADDIEKNAVFLAQLQGPTPILSAAGPSPQHAAPVPATPAINIGLS